MVVETEVIRREYLRHDKKFPHVWCPGCGNGIVLGSLLRAIHGLGLPKDDVVVVSGIGCSSRMTTYIDFNTLHTTHGRALTFATGVKLAKPRLKVIAVMGDGDATAIGGNHFIHAARRNISITAIIVNNSTYGMTGGQYSPTTPYGSRSTTSVYGHVEHDFSIAELAVTAGASFVARGTVYHAAQLDKLLEEAMSKRGFSVVEVISNCHVQHGRRNKLGDAVTMITGFRDRAVPVAKAAKMTAEEMQGKFSIGVLCDVDKPVSTEEYERIRSEACQLKS
ncbi:2-oxoacid:ferredoxin oxidoreductase subunit beta [Desulfofustis limnaeus]|jgi:2-oxoglutarate ferredoxin oxidoreductase subunit beta|uniref:2-oxoglutarate ferredoxin oxidoreductase subunit beta n=1 Tax=Desulfofustis limnaeus TaxID=2740163 RepID=A0ABN6M2U5_9BACT|nr:2-oxoacid:ferredoxin oxidoreductase subunit beta [Desulfofustis limnaeus]MDX9896035.1 2-oxoacid:ferredoxin oxidoreductase subunit beta [Desulfofustis sp.]BDD87206.1 2-oxoglutarate ferredoxin oxidoreductase subunit beta [Desulfofustis limnaeus]